MLPTAKSHGTRPRTSRELSAAITHNNGGRHVSWVEEDTQRSASHMACAQYEALLQCASIQLADERVREAKQFENYEER